MQQSHVNLSDIAAIFTKAAITCRSYIILLRDISDANASNQPDSLTPSMTILRLLGENAQ
ncbi:hypothetical protein GCM10007984_13200 [Shewanella putrefaciens]|nr:hypothetical protein GCM10007984_13200 [Shewanella putrefaciens]